eukprot:scaffold298546_cov34-Prasinocladus_malaysianus.AAC.1
MRDAWGLSGESRLLARRHRHADRQGALNRSKPPLKTGQGGAEARPHEVSGGERADATSPLPPRPLLLLRLHRPAGSHVLHKPSELLYCVNGTTNNLSH